jgi:hypothetical protein
MIIKAVIYCDFVKKNFETTDMNAPQQHFNDLNDTKNDKCFELKCIKRESCAIVNAIVKFGWNFL